MTPKEASFKAPGALTGQVSRTNNVNLLRQFQQTPGTGVPKVPQNTHMNSFNFSGVWESGVCSKGLLDMVPGGPPNHFPSDGEL